MGGEMKFKYQGSGGGMKLVKKRATGNGEIFFAKNGSQIFLIQLEGEALSLNTSKMLAFDSSIEWDIKMIGGGLGAGLVAGGFTNLFLQGHGMVAIASHGEPLLLD